MKVWAIGDLHLSGANPKPMEIFDEQWKNHDEKISTAWRDIVATNDLVIVAGDTSWAMKLQEAIVERMKRLYDWDIKPEDIVFSPGNGKRS